MYFSISGLTDHDEVCRKRNKTTSLLEYANDNRHAGMFNDVVIITGEKSIPANRMVLSCFSKYFETMFQSEMKEKYEPCVNIENVKAISMKSVIEFMYTGVAEINSKNVCELLSAADFFQMEDLKQFCIDFLESSLNPQTCFIILALTNLYENVRLRSLALEYIALNFSKVAATDHFKTLTKEDIAEFLSQPQIKMIEGRSLYKAVMEWIRYDSNARKNDTCELLQYIPLHELSSEFLKQIVSMEELVVSHPDASRLLINALKHLLNGQACQRKLLCFGGTTTGTCVTEVFNTKNIPYREYPPLPDFRLFGCSLTFQNSVYFIGGMSRQGNGERTVWCMNLEENELKWKEMCSMHVSRCVLGGAICNENLVVVGGVDDCEYLSSCEYYIPSLDTWKKMPFLRQARAGHSVVFCRDRLYAIGGYNKNGQYLSNVECYQMLGGVWQNVKPMQTPRTKFSAVIYNDFIYVFGGRYSRHYESTLKTVEKYNIASNEWTFVKNMKFERSELAATVLEGKIYVVGGVNAEGKAVKEIEFYDPVLDEWSIVGKTDKSYYGHSLVAL